MEKYLRSYPFEIPKLGIGMAALGRPGYINLNHGKDLKGETDTESMYQNSKAVLDTAWKSGIRYFDAARSYGKAEEFLSRWLKEQGIKRNEIIVVSKWGYEYTADWQVQAEHHEIKEHSLKMLQKQWPESKRWLGDFLKLYQIHSATLKSGVLENKAVLKKLFEIKNDGVRIGLTLSGANQASVLEKAMKLKMDGIPLFDSVQATYNMFEQSAEPALKEASSQGIVVVVKEALANGRLTNRNKEADAATKLNFLNDISLKLGTTIDALALSYVIQKPWVDIVLSGAVTVPQLKSNMQSLDLANKPLPDELNKLKEDPAQYWQKRTNLEWN